MEDDSDILSCFSESESKNYHLPSNDSVFIDIQIQGICQIGLQKFTKYLIYGNDFKGSFQISRRFKEFKRLHEVLSLNWLGCIVPVIPKKKTFVSLKQGNFKHDFLEKRKQSLSIFLKKITKLEYLYLDEYFQQFLRCETYFLIISKDFISPNFNTLAKKYKIAFEPILENALIDDEINKIEETCKENIKVLKDFRKKIKKSEEITEKYHKNHRTVYENIESLSNFLKPEKELKKLENTKIVNPIEDLVKDSKFVIKELKTLLTCISKFFRLKKSIKSFESQIVNYETLVEELRNGRKSLITTKSADLSLVEIEKVQNNVKTDMDSLSFMIEKISRQIQSEFFSFESSHYPVLSISIKKFADLSINNYENLAADALGLEVKFCL